ncbi:MAG: site-specific integrase [Thermoplasmatales archaeon]|nr:site-specific integrase [Thermoplasmatales archaeon]
MNTELLKQLRDYVCSNHQSENTRRNYIDNPIRMLKHIGKRYKDITQEDLNKYIQYCYEKYKRNTLSQQFWILKDFIRWTGRTDLSLPKIQPVDSGHTAIDSKEMDKIFAVIEDLSPIHRLVFYLVYDAIRRPMEIMNIKITDRHGDILKYYGKTGNTVGVRHCLLTERLQQAWDDYLTVRPEPKSVEDKKVLLLNDRTAYRGRRMLTTSQITHMLREICLFASLEIPDGEKPTAYMFKRTTITQQLLEGADIKLVQFQAGHTRPETTLKYHRINDEDVRKYLRRLEDKTQDVRKFPNKNK